MMHHTTVRAQGQTRLADQHHQAQRAAQAAPPARPAARGGWRGGAGCPPGRNGRPAHARSPIPHPARNLKYHRAPQRREAQHEPNL
jgi:hypothetical protein